MDYHFEEVQNLRVAVYDVDDKKHLDDLSRHDFIGEAKFTLAEVVAAGRVFTRRLTSASEYMTIKSHYFGLWFLVLPKISSVKQCYTMPYSNNYLITQVL